MIEAVFIVCIGVILVTSVFLYYYLYQLVLLDAKSRDIAHPKLWSLFATSGQNSSGLFLYLFKRRKTTSFLTAEQNLKFLGIKRKIYCLMGLELAVFLMMLANLIRGIR
ncbi:hypothetical protein [Enterococcus alishanensis]|uniref:Uncharacterized protein n=1 Tax=Enterococcus alishanensis TaxID=1303817 RepID=A0ABS6TCP3_9ENTE|nr:hypothetical protein [Enterococcus alishanensis]MBV7390647.1 hypothetical protein [Enterococcus alishanensis]